MNAAAIIEALGGPCLPDTCVCPLCGYQTLHIEDKNGKTLWNCLATCGKEAVTSALMDRGLLGRGAPRGAAARGGGGDGPAARSNGANGQAPPLAVKTPPPEAFFLSLVSVYLLIGRLDAATMVVEHALSIYPNTHLLTNRLAEVQARAGDPSAARRSYERALELDPSNAVAQRGLDALGDQ